jgi:hypothetical protein
MASRYSPKIPTSNLVLAWDAANPKSYPGSGTTIYDLSGNGNSGTLVNSPSFGKSTAGDTNVITVNRSAQSYINQVGTLDLSTAASTVIAGTRYTNVTAGRMISAKTNNWLMGHWSTSVKTYYAEGWITATNNGGSDTNWRIYASTNNQPSDQYTLYVNGVLEAGPSNAGSQGPSGFQVGRYHNNTNEFSDGEFSFLYVYNRILSTAELDEAYNAMRGRFNL